MSGKKGMKRHSMQFRQELIRCHLEENLATRELAEKFGINTTQVHLWIKWYKQYGVPMLVTGLKKGRPPKKNNKSNTQTENNIGT